MPKLPAAVADEHRIVYAYAWLAGIVSVRLPGVRQSSELGGLSHARATLINFA